MIFWAISSGLAALAALILTAALWRGRGAGEARRFDVKVYRDQLREVERDLARGVVSETEAGAIRTEVSRRLLDADKADRAAAATAAAPRLASGIATVLVALAVLGGSFASYLGTATILSYCGWTLQEIAEARARTTFTLKIRGNRVSLSPIFDGLGAPGYPDQPLEARYARSEEVRRSRIGQEEAEALAGTPPAAEADPDYLALIDQLRAKVAERPDDLQGHRLLAREEAKLGNYAAARKAQSQVIAILGDTAGAGEFTALAELCITAANGYVSPEAETALREALARDPEDPAARYFSGRLAVQIGRYDVAFRLWSRLLDEGPANAPWIPPIRADIGALAELAGVRYTPPPATDAPGPSAADLDAASEMTPEERTEMIRTMVAGLADRLAKEGGSPEEWARLIRAYGVLGETDRAAAIWAEAQQVFPEEAARAPIRDAARDAGVTE